MKKVLYILVALIIIITITVFAIGPMNTVIYFVKPDHSFLEDTKAESPDYKNENYWAALPHREDLADLRPEGIQADTLLKKIDVFFIHPTGYLKGNHWNSPLENESGTEENTMWMMANQASAFSDCNVYAPRYREATIFSFFNTEGVDEKAALDFAYNDVARAFELYISKYNKGRPFIIASHSQGSYHAMTLIKSKIDKTSLRDQMVAAYIIGMSTITSESVAELTSIKVCSEADQTNCIIHWATFAMVSARPEGWGKTMICVNPISWKTDNKMVVATDHKGYVPSTGTYNLAFYGNDKKEDVLFDKLPAPIREHTSAICVEGRLLVEKQTTPSIAMGEGNYHGLDFPLFHMDIRLNVSQRVRKYLLDTKPLSSLPN